MAKKVITQSELDEIQKEEAMGFGEESKCYFLKDSFDIIKIYLPNKRLESINFTDKKSLYIAFPKDVLVDAKTGEIVANTMPFLPGEKIFTFPKELEISKLKEAYNILIEEIKKFPDIYMLDLCLDNILFDINTNRFYLIDTGRWHELPDVSSLNQARIDINLSSALYNSGLDWFKNYPELAVENKELYNFLITSKNIRYCPFLEFLDALKEEIEKKFNQEVITIGDLVPKTYKKS